MHLIRACVFQMGGHGVFGGSGGMAQLRGMHPMNPPQGIRAQVPPQFLSPQVLCSSVLSASVCPKCSTCFPNGALCSVRVIWADPLHSAPYGKWLQSVLLLFCNTGIAHTFMLALWLHILLEIQMNCQVKGSYMCVCLCESVNFKFFHLAKIRTIL